MNLQPLHRNAQAGYILLPVMLLLSLLAMAAVMLSYEGSIGRYLTLQRAEPEEAFYVAEAGLQYATWQIQRSNCINYADIGATPFGSHSFSATIAPDNGSPVDINATGILDNGLSRSLLQKGIKVFAESTSTTLQPGPAEGKDSNVKNKANDVPKGYAQDLFIDNAPDVNNANISLLDFDLAAIPPGSSIISAVLELYAFEVDTVPGGGAITLHRLLEPWIEADVTYQTPDGSSTWTWPANYEAAPAAATTLTIGNTGWYSWDITGLVEGWTAGSYPNHGMVLAGSPEVYWSAFRSSDYTVPALHPKLTVTYACECGGSTQELVLQPGPEGQDSYIMPGTNQNYGASAIMVVKDLGQRAVVKFAVPTLPSGATITSASLQLNMQSLANYNLPGYLDVFRLTQYWDEGTRDGGVVTPDGLTWTNYDATNFWAAPGGDYNAVLEASTPVDPALGWHSWDVTDMVTSWADGSQQNYGLIVIGRDYVQNATFTSGDASTAELRPKLVINYLCPCGSNCIAPSDPTAYYRDEFSVMTCDPTVDYIGSNGPKDWTPWSWTEINETLPDSCNGGIRLAADMGSNRLSVNETGKGAERPVNLAAFNRGFLRFDYRRQFTNTGEYVDIRISPDGGAQWLVIDTITGTGSDPDYTTACYDITPYVSLNTVIGFTSYNFDNSNNTLFFDNFQVSQEPCPVPPEIATFGPVDDTWLDQSQPNTNYHNDPLMQVGESTVVNIFFRPMIKFDISSLPPGTNVVSATLRLYVANVQGVQPMTVGLYRINSEWQANVVTWNSESGGDFHPVPLSLPSISWTPGWKEWPVPLELINEWLDGVTPNHGLLLNYLGNKKNYYLQFATKNYSTATLQPQLVIEYLP